MSEPTAADDAALLRDLADRIESNGQSPIEGAPGDLRRIAGHLARIATGGDRPAPTGLTAQPSTYKAKPSGDD